jgi:hypothetical protein
MVISDKGTDLTIHAVPAWCQDIGSKWHRISPGKPQVAQQPPQNGFDTATRTVRQVVAAPVAASFLDATALMP